MCSGIVLNILLGYFVSQVSFWTFYLVILCLRYCFEHFTCALLHFTWLFCAQVLFWTFYLVILCSGIVLNILLGYFVLRYSFEHFTWLFCAQVLFWTFYLVQVLFYLFCAQVLFWTFYLVILCSGIVLNILLGYFVLRYCFEHFTWVITYFVSRYNFEHFTWL